MFSYKDCCYAIQKSKETCGRIVMYKEFEIANSYTLEASFMGPTKGVFAGLHFNPQHLYMVGRIFCETLLEHKTNTEKVDRIADYLNKKYPQGSILGHAADPQSIS